MADKNKQVSFYVLLALTITFTVVLMVSAITKIKYDQTKSNMLEEIKTNAKTSLLQLKKSIVPYMESYSPAEYEKLLANEMFHKDIYAIVIEDHNMANILNTKTYFVGKKRDHNWNTINYDPQNKEFGDKVKEIYFYEKSDIENENGLKLGTITIYSTDVFVKEELKTVIRNSILIGIAICAVFIFILFFLIKGILLNPIDDIIQLITNDLKDGIPNNTLPKYSVKELSVLSKTINSMIEGIKDSRKKLNSNIAFLKSHQIAMDQSSIVTKADLKGRITYVNDNFCKITGYTKEEVLGKPHSLVRHADTPKEIFEDLWKTIKSKKVWKGTMKNKGKLDDYWVDTTILPILDENDNIVEYMAVRHDISQVIHQQEKLDNIANTDVLTGLGNRYKLLNDIKKSISPALAILNIDNFSQVNDFYGHETGDNIITQIGSELSGITSRSYCDVYHLQGDEYVIFNPDIKKDIFLEKIDSFINELGKIEVKVDAESLSFNFSIGISFESKDNILTTADMALKIAKKDNESLIIYNEKDSLNKEYENNIKWTKKIKEAIENDNIVPVFQPIVNNSNNVWEKYESLVRIKDEDKLISPYFFLDISKKTKHYTTITKIMIRKSFEMFKDKDCEFSVNLTIEDILNREIKTFILLMLDTYKIGSRVVFEIVESESIENFEKVSKFINDIKAYNCKVAIDDFGTGYSNFEYLLKLKADYIKIDGSMIKDIDTNKDAQLVVSTIIDFAKKMGMKTIAEFVENESILNKVKEMDIDYSQGYYFSAPKQTIQR